jgi:protein disulfide-isomerase A6
LESILKRGSLAPSKLDELKIKANILSAFVADKASEVKESVVKKVEAEL